MKELDHCNVLELSGICFEENSVPLVLLPYMSKGDLSSYIRDIENNLTIEEMLFMLIGIAEGM